MGFGSDGSFNKCWNVGPDPNLVCGRMIDAILTNTMLPDISREFLTRMMDGRDVGGVEVSVKDGDFEYTFQ